VACCSAIDAVVSNDQVQLQSIPLAGLRLAIPQSLVLDDVEDVVAFDFSNALRKLAGAGVVITEEPCDELLSIPDINAKGGFAAAESYAQHRQLIADHYHDYDPHILRRILKGREQSAADYLDIVRARRELKEAFWKISSKYDALICPTVPRIAPKLSDLVDDESYDSLNLLMLRNPAVVNLIDGCAVSVPCHEVGGPAVGLMLVSEPGSDGRLLSIASSVEMLLAPKH
jgi:aspartyl-tRNA(Asn)/glutamyl-tRNA(Gln) amidotransferase subunit A